MELEQNFLICSDLLFKNFQIEHISGNSRKLYEFTVKYYKSICV